MALPFRYSVGNLFARRTRTALTLGVVAVVVLATTLLLSLVSSLRRTLVTTGSPHNLIVMRKGATNDGSSALPLEAYQAGRSFAGIAKAPGDEANALNIPDRQRVGTHVGGELARHKTARRGQM